LDETTIKIRRSKAGIVSRTNHGWNGIGNWNGIWNWNGIGERFVAKHGRSSGTGVNSFEIWTARESVGFAIS
jgi:hypothetical protein